MHTAQLVIKRVQKYINMYQFVFRSVCDLKKADKMYKYLSIIA
jgi:ribonucleotide reductase beta subunit family protein with ferritin-like domain